MWPSCRSGCARLLPPGIVRAMPLIDCSPASPNESSCGTEIPSGDGMNPRITRMAESPRAPRSGVTTTTPGDPLSTCPRSSISCAGSKVPRAVARRSARGASAVRARSTIGICRALVAAALAARRARRRERCQMPSRTQTAATMNIRTTNRMRARGDMAVWSRGHSGAARGPGPGSAKDTGGANAVRPLPWQGLITDSTGPRS